MFLVKLRSQFFTCKTAAAGHSSPGTRAHHSDLYLLPNQTKQTQHSNTSADWTLKCWCDKRRSEKHCVRNPVRKKKGRLLQLVPKFTATLIGQKNDSWKHHLPRTIKYPLESSSLLLCGRTNLTMWATTERVKQLTGEPLAFTLREQRRAAAAHFNFSTVRTKKKKSGLKKDTMWSNARLDFWKKVLEMSSESSLIQEIQLTEACSHVIRQNLNIP